MSAISEARECADSMADAADFLHDALQSGEVDTAKNALREVESSSMRIRRYLEEIEAEEEKANREATA